MPQCEFIRKQVRKKNVCSQIIQMSVVQITSDAQYQEAKASGIVAVKFYADWCGPCKTLAPAVDDFAVKYTDIKFYSMDCEQFDEIFESLDGSSLPYVVFFKNGEKVDSFVGNRKENLENKIVNIVANKD